MDRNMAETIRQQSEDLREELKDLEQWEDAVQARELAKAQRKVPLPTVATAIEPPIRGTVPSLKEAVRQQQQQHAREANSKGCAAADPIQQAKEKGNELFQKGHMSEAVAAYTTGIDSDPASSTTHVLYANRAMCYLKLSQWMAAEKDATTCIHMNTGYAKAYYRRAIARKHLGKLREARADLEAVLALAPKDLSAQQEMESVTRMLQAERAAANTAAAQTTAASTSKKKRIVIEEVESDDDEAIAEAAKVSASKTSAEEAQRQSYAEENIRQLAAARESHAAQLQQKAERAAAVQAQKQRRHARVEIIEDVEEEREQFPKGKTAPSPASTTPALVQTPSLSTSSPQGSSVSSPRTTTAGTRAPRAITRESLTAPKSFGEFERRFREVDQQPDLRDYYVQQLNPATMKSLFGSNMTPEMLLGILQAVKTFTTESALQYVKGLCQVSRVEDLTLFFNEQEKAVVQDVLDLLRSAPGMAAKDIQSIERKLKPM